MNGRKILNELIAIFIFLNIALFTFNIIKTVGNYRLSNARVNNIIYALGQKQIYLETQIPKGFEPKAPANLSDLLGNSTTVERYDMVSALFGAKNGNVIVSKDSSHPDVITHQFGSEALEFNKNMIIYTNNAVSESEGDAINPQNAKKVCNAFIKRLNYSKVFTDAHIQYSEVENGLEMTFFEKFEGLPVFDTYIAFELVNDQIKRATIKIGKVSQLKGENTKQFIYPLDLVLFGIDDDLELEKPIYITNITLGYKAINQRNITLFGAQLIPVYKVEVKGLNSPIYVNAYTNRRIE